MSKKITGSEYPLSKIFSSDFDFKIPPYQRPYTWTETEANELFDDLYEAYDADNSEDYFLGSIVLIKDDNNPTAEVIDGQQRLTTLSILIAAIANQADEAVRAELLDYIKEKGKITQGLPAKPRLTLRKTDNEFFFNYIQSLKFDELFTLQNNQLKTEAQQHIQKNAWLFTEKIKNKILNNADFIVTFGSFVVQHCYLVAVSSPSRESAFRVFSVLNNRGLDLLPSDIIKADVIGKIDSTSQNKYTEKWEQIENQTGRDKFNELFGHIRMIFAKRKQQNTLLEEFKIYVMEDISPENLIDDVIDPYAEAFRILTKCDFQSTENAESVNKLLSWLNKIDNTDWLPPAIFYFSKHHQLNDVVKFLTKLERLAAFMHICAENVNYRIDRYSQIIDEISQEIWPQSIELRNKEINKMLKCLSGDIYTDLTGVKRNYLILRLDSFVSDSAAQYAPATLTIEHVLPQTVNNNSLWMTWWPDDEKRIQWVHRIANLVPLSRQKNSEAQNYEFDVKKDKYFKGKYGTSSYALTTQVLNTETWTPEVLEERQKKLLNTLIENWDLVADNMLDEQSEDQNNVINRRKNFKFSDYGIPIGAELAFTRKKTITCIVVNDVNRVMYCNEEYSLSGLAQKLLLEQCGIKWKSAQGAEHFCYQDTKLLKLSKKQN